MKKEKITGIYMIASPTGKIYIGQAIDIYRRWDLYKSFHCKSQRKLYNSFKKHGIERHGFSIIHVCAEDQLDEKEVYYIKLYDTFNTMHGLNLTSGGEGGKMSDESIEKMRKSNTGKRHTEETRKRLSIIRSGTKTSEETKHKIRNAMLGRKLGEETIGRIKASAGKHLKGKKLSPGHIEKIRKSLIGRKRPKCVIDMLRNRVPTHEHRMAVGKAIREYWAKIKERGGRIVSKEERLRKSIASKKMWARRKQLGLKRKVEQKKRQLSPNAIAQRKIIAQRIKDHPDYNSEENRRKRHERQVRAAQTKKDNISKQIEQESRTMIF